MTGGRLKRVARLLETTRPSASPTATASPTSTSQRLSTFHRAHGDAGDGDRRAARRAASARCELDGPTRDAVPREARRRRRLDQRRLLRALAKRRAATSTATTPCGSRSRCERLAADGAAGAPTSTPASGSRWTRCATRAARGAVGSGTRARGRCGDRPTPSGAAGASCVTGHTGFKGAWLVALAARAGRGGHRLSPACRPAVRCSSSRDVGRAARRRSTATSATRGAVRRGDVEAAGPRSSSTSPPSRSCAGRTPTRSATFATNVMGTVNVLEARARRQRRARSSSSPPTSLRDRDGRRLSPRTTRSAAHDPYCASKAAAELVVAAYRQQLLRARRGRRWRRPAPATSSAAATGREDRLVPDIVRARSARRAASCSATRTRRPWQHVLEPLEGYLLLAERLWTDGATRRAALNFGPDRADDVRDGRELVAAAVDALWRRARAGARPASAAASAEARVAGARREHSARSGSAGSPRWTLDERAATGPSDWYRRHAAAARTRAR